MRSVAKSCKVALINSVKYVNPLKLILFNRRILHDRIFNIANSFRAIRIRNLVMISAKKVI